MKLLKTMLIALLIPAVSFGQVKYIEKDTPAPYTGFLFTPEKEQQIRLTLIEHDFLKLELEVYKDTNKLLQERANLWQKQSTELANELVKKERLTFWQNTLYFGLGAILTGVLAVGVSRAVR